MSHYEKIAVVIIRVVGCFIAIYAVASAFYAVVVTLPSAAMNVCVFYLLLGIAVLALSRSLARLAVRGIENE